MTTRPRSEMPAPSGPSAPEGPAFDAAGEAKRLLRAIRAGALATTDPDGAPFASLVNVATAPDGSPILLLSRLAAHTRHLEAAPGCSLLLAQAGKGDPLAHPRLTLAATAVRDADPALRGRFLRRHPKSALYVDFPDFSFWRLVLERGHLNGGFAKAATLDPATLLTSLMGAQALVVAEAGAVAHMNEDHAEAVALYATHFAGQEPGPWRLSGLDPEGMDLMAGDRTARVAFAEPVADPARLRGVLVAMAAQARAGR
jgi:putative heme iron utilization protein